MTEPWFYNYIIFWLCIVGLCFGSFYNVVILRTLSGESIVFPPSKCPKCGNRLKAWHNIPVLSYICLGGKCAFCKERISIQYPIIELITMGLFLFSFIKFGVNWKTLFAILLSSSLLIMTLTDLKEKLIDCNIAIFLAIIGLIYNGLVVNNVLDSILGLLVGALILEIIARLGYLFTDSRAMGEGDTYVAAALGACFGLQGILTILIYTLIASMLFIIPIFLYNQLKNNNKLTCILFILFTLSVLTFKTLSQSYYILIILSLLGIILAINILSSLKKQEASSLTYLPYVPAFSIATLYFLFF